MAAKAGLAETAGNRLLPVSRKAGRVLDTLASPKPHPADPRPRQYNLVSSSGLGSRERCWAASPLQPVRPPPAPLLLRPRLPRMATPDTARRNQARRRVKAIPRG